MDNNVFDFVNDAIKLNLLVKANENLKPDPHPAQLRPDLTTLSKSINNRQLTALVTGSLSGRHTFLIIFRPKAH